MLFPFRLSLPGYTAAPAHPYTDVHLHIIACVGQGHNAWAAEAMILTQDPRGTATAPCPHCGHTFSLSAEPPRLHSSTGTPTHGRALTHGLRRSTAWRTMQKPNSLIVDPYCSSRACRQSLGLTPSRAHHTTRYRPCTSHSRPANPLGAHPSLPVLGTPQRRVKPTALAAQPLRARCGPLRLRVPAPHPLYNPLYVGDPSPRPAPPSLPFPP
jgi:hypothetical protein